MKKIKLTKGQFTIIDDSDFKKLSKIKWFATYDKVRNVYKSINSKFGLLHRFIMNAPKGMVVDHINHNTLDNRRCNLRLCTPNQNRYNLNLRKNSKSGYKGISFKKNHWEVQLKKDKKYIYGGSFKDKIEAAKAYDKKARELFGEYAKLNF